MSKDSTECKLTRKIKRGIRLELYWHDFAWVGSILAFFVVCLELFYRMIVNYNDKYPSDMPYYAKYIITNEATHDRFIETLSHFLYKINHNTMEFNIYLALVIAAIVVVNYMLISFYIENDGIGDCVPRYAIQIASLVVLFIGPIYSTHFHKFFYKGSFASFAWQSPTQQSMILFSLVATLCFLKMYLSYKEGVSSKWWFATAATMLMSAYVKPSFALALIPSVVVLFIIELFNGDRDSLRKRFISLFIMGCSLIPAGLYILLLHSLEFGEDTLNGGSYQTIIGLQVWRQKSDVMTMFVFGMAFVIVVVATNIKRFRDSKYFLAILLFVMGFMQWAFIAETGERAKHGNFTWGRMYATYFLTLICVTIMLENLFKKDGFFASNKKLRYLLMAIIGIVFAASVLSQIRYFALILTGHGYWQ